MRAEPGRRLYWNWVTLHRLITELWCGPTETGNKWGLNPQFSQLDGKPSTTNSCSVVTVPADKNMKGWPSMLAPHEVVESNRSPLTACYFHWQINIPGLSCWWADLIPSSITGRMLQGLLSVYMVQAGGGTGKWSGTVEFYRNIWEHINQATFRW